MDCPSDAVTVPVVVWGWDLPVADLLAVRIVLDRQLRG